MSVVAAIVTSAIISGGVAMKQSSDAKKAAKKQEKAAAALAAQNKDKLVVTPKGITKKNARAALVVGSPKGVLSTEDQTATSGRGTLLGN